MVIFTPVALTFPRPFLVHISGWMPGYIFHFKSALQRKELMAWSWSLGRDPSVTAATVFNSSDHAIMTVTCLPGRLGSQLFPRQF